MHFAIQGSLLVPHTTYSLRFILFLMMPTRSGSNLSNSTHQIHRRWIVQAMDPAQSTLRLIIIFSLYSQGIRTLALGRHPSASSCITTQFGYMNLHLRLIWVFYPHRAKLNGCCCQGASAYSKSNTTHRAYVNLLSVVRDSDPIATADFVIYSRAVFFVLW